MKAIFLGAGRGARLMPHTRECPKSLTELHERRLLDYGIEAMRAADPDELVCVVGWRGERVQEAYPQLTYRHNRAWERTNILASLFCAEDCMDGGFLVAYTDILFTAETVRALAAHPGDIVLAVDTAWRERYRHRSQHPEDDAEKVLAQGDRVTRICRTIPSAAARGEYIGVARFSPRGAATLRRHHARCAAAHAEGPFQQARSFATAYLIDLYQQLLDQGETIHLVETRGGYIEIDTLEDYEYALRAWPSNG